MTAFIAEAVADTPPCWRDPHHALSNPDTLVPTRDPAHLAWLQERAEAWAEAADRDRTDRKTVRLWTLEDHPADPDQPVVYRAHRQTTPETAWKWFRSMTTRPGHRLVLVDKDAPNRSDNLLEDLDEPCDCGETRPSLAYEAHKHREAAS